MEQREKLIGIALKVFAQLVALPQTGTDEDRFYQAVSQSLIAIRGRYQTQPMDSIQRAVQEQSMQSPQPVQQVTEPTGGTY